MARLRVAILISGRGSNMASLIEAAREADHPADVALVVSNVPGAGGLVRAAEAGVAAVTVDHREYVDRKAFETRLDGALHEHGIEFLCLAGFMRLLTPWFVERWTGRMLNIHPSLLPSFKGLDTHARALDAGVRLHGCTVHFVVPELDSGPIVAQAAVPVYPDDTPETLGSRVLQQEHILYPLGLELVAGGHAVLQGRHVVFGPNVTRTHGSLVVPEGAGARPVV